MYSGIIMSGNIADSPVMEEMDGNQGLTRGSLAKKKIMFLHSKNKASRKGYKGEC